MASRKPVPADVEESLLRLDELRSELRGAGNPDREGRFSCDGCVAWCCRDGANSMRATPLEAEAVARLVASRGPDAVAEALRRVETVIVAAGLVGGGEAGSASTYTCPFLDPANRCGVHAAKPLGCITFTPVRDGGCDQDAELLGEALEACAELNDEAFGDDWRDRPFPVAVRSALNRRV